MQLINILPPGLMAKLRLVPDKSLSPRLAHLLTVSNIEANEEELGFPYECLSVENIDTISYFIDHDVIVRNLRTGRVTIIDCTSDLSLAKSKAQFLRERIRGVDNIDQAFVHVFTPKKFLTRIKGPSELQCSNTKIFNLLEDISLSDKDVKDAIFSACDDIYETSCSEILTADRPELNERYDYWTLPDRLVEEAILLCTEHNMEDPVMFKSVASVPQTAVYYETFKKILLQQRPLTPPFALKPATYNLRNDLSSVLIALSENIIAKALYFAMKNNNKWVGIDLFGVLYTNVLMPGRIVKMLPTDSPYLICARHVEGHIFCIKFSDTVIDENFKEQVLKAPKSNRRTEKFSEDVDEAFMEMQLKLKAYHTEFMEPNTERAMNTISGKLLTLCDLYSRDSVAPPSCASSMLSKVISAVDTTRLGDMITMTMNLQKHLRLL